MSSRTQERERTRIRGTQNDEDGRITRRDDQPRLTAKEQALADQRDAMLAALDELAGGRFDAEEGVTFEGDKLILPESMTAQSAIEALESYIESQTNTVHYSRQFRYRPWDGAAAVPRALKRIGGMSGIGRSTFTFFGEFKPEMRSIDVGVNKKTQVPWGRVEFPPLDAMLTLDADMDPEYGMLFTLHVETLVKHKARVEALFTVIQDELEQRSIYKGKVINGASDPGFIDPYLVKREEVIYTDEVFRQLQANMWVHLEHTQLMRDLNVPLKRSVLFSGPYGTGKSLGAMLTAQTATENGWTFIQCRPQDNLGDVLKTALLYQPAVVFYEDLDQAAKAGDSDKVAELLDMFDGIGAKGHDLIICMTTNAVEEIHKGMVRPGRLDAIVEIGALDGEAKERLIKAVVPYHLLDTNIDYDAVDKATTEFLPAFLKECIGRAMLYAIARTKGKPKMLTTQDFTDAALGLQSHLELMKGAGHGQPTPDTEIALTRIVEKVVHGSGFYRADEDSHRATPTFVLQPVASNGKG